MSHPEPNAVYRSGRVLRLGTPLLASLVAAATTAGIQTVLPLEGPWVPVVAASGGVAVAALLSMWKSVTRRRLEVFDGWFRYVLPGRTLIAHWDDVIAVFGPAGRRRRLFGRHEYALVLGGGTTVRLGSQIGADVGLGDEIEARTREVITARTAAHLASGREVAFGPITVRADGIEVRAMGKRTIPFDRLRDQRLGRRHYLVRSLDSRRTTAVPVSRIPSPGALHDLIEREVTKARDRKSPAAA